MVRSESDSNVKALPVVAPVLPGHRRSSSMPGHHKGGVAVEEAGPVERRGGDSEGGVEYAVVVACRCSHTGEH
jgi:hypothetical protein